MLDYNKTEDTLGKNNNIHLYKSNIYVEYLYVFTCFQCKSRILYKEYKKIRNP